MKVAALTAIILGAGSLAAGSEGPVSEYMVTVYATSEPGASAGSAPLLTTRMFADIGINLQWLYNRRSPARAPRINLKSCTPYALRPGALAYAMPCKGPTS